MREPERIDRIIELIEQLWKESPDLRFNQLISNLWWEYSGKNNNAGKQSSYSKWVKDDIIAFREDVHNVDLFHLEDDKFEEFLKSKIK